MRTGSLVLALHNLDLSGANQVLVNIVSSSLRESNVVVLAPKLGPASQRFFDVGASIRIGDPKTILNTISDVILVLCNTIMTADIICFLKERQTPSIWVLHEFWDAGQIEQQIKMRPNVSHINVEVIKAALQMASTVVFVCEAQKDLYLSLLGERAIAPYEVIYVGVPSIPHGDDDADIISYSTGGKKKRGIKDRFTADKIPRSSVSLPAVPSSSNITITRTDTHLHDVKDSHSTATDALRSLLGIDKSTGGLVPVPPSSVPTGLATSADESAAVKSSTLHTAATTPKSPDLVFTILVLGVVCPRKNQLWAVRMLEALSNRLHHQHEEKDEKLGRMDDVPDEQREREATLVSPSSERGSCAATFVQHPVSRHRKVLTGESGRVRRGVLDSDSEGALSDTELLECNDETCLDFPAESVPGSNPSQPVGAPEAATSATSSSEGRTPPLLPLLDKSEAAMDADHQSAQISDTGRVATTAEDGRGMKLKLLIVGMRRSRPYEVEYGEKVEKEAARVNALLAARQGPVRCHNGSDGASDAAIEVHPVTDDVNAFFDRANCLLVPSTNEVTPLVIVEAMARQLPVLCTRVGGISEMLTHGVEGFLFSTEPPPPPPAKAGLRARTRRIYNSGDWRQYCGDTEEEAKEEKQANEGTVVDSIPAPTSEGLAAGTGCEFLECTDHLLNLIASPSLCQQLGHNGRHRFLSQFRVELMTHRYLSLIRRLSPPVVLVDLDGVVVDWDAGFLAAWRGLFAHWAGTGPSPDGSQQGTTLYSFTSAEDLARLRALLPASHAPGSPAPEPERHRNFEMPLCLPSEYRALAEALFHLPGFFLCLPQKQGALQALLEMRACNLEVMLCSAPLMTSAYCAQEKVEWVRRHLGLSWLSRLILTCEKSGMKGDVLIDDKPIRAIRAASAAAAAPPSSTTSSAAVAAPSSRGEHSFAATWRQVIFDMPYNKGESDPRLLAWSEWPGVVLPMVGMDPLQYQEAVMSVNGAQPIIPAPQSEGVSGVHPPSTGAAALPPRNRAAPAVWPPPTLSRPILTRTSTHPPASERALPAPVAASAEAHGWWGQYQVPSRYDQSTLPEVVNTTYLGQPITVLNPWTAPMCMSLASRSRPSSPCPPQAEFASARATVSHGKEAKVDHSTPLGAMAKVGSESAEGADVMSTAAVSGFPTSASRDQEQGVDVPVASSEPSKKSAERLVSAGIFATPPQTPPQTPPSTPPPATLPTISEDDVPNVKEGDYCGAFDRYGKCLHAEASPGPLFPCTCHGSTTLCPRITEGERKARQFLDCFKAVAPRPEAGLATGPHGVQGFGLHGTPAPSSTSLHKGKYVSTEGVIFNGQDLESGNGSDAMDLDHSAAGDVSAPAGYKWPATKGCLGRPEAGKQSRLDDDPRDRSFDLCDAADCVQMEELKEEGPEPEVAAAAAAAAPVPEGQGKAISKSTSATSLSSTGTNWSTRTVRNADSDSYLEEGSQSDH